MNKKIMKKLKNSMGYFVQVTTEDGKIKGFGDLVDLDIRENDPVILLHLEDDEDDYIINYNTEKDTIRIGNLSRKDRLAKFKIESRL
ncbi:MAG: hypothetical protein ACTSPV_12440 [Candidatus Hodarchaeales archaeon]